MGLDPISREPYTKHSEDIQRKKKKKKIDTTLRAVSGTSQAEGTQFAKIHRHEGLWQVSGMARASVYLPMGCLGWVRVRSDGTSTRSTHERFLS